MAAGMSHAAVGVWDKNEMQQDRFVLLKQKNSFFIFFIGGLLSMNLNHHHFWQSNYIYWSSLFPSDDRLLSPKLDHSSVCVSPVSLSKPVSAVPPPPVSPQLSDPPMPRWPWRHHAPAAVHRSCKKKKKGYGKKIIKRTNTFNGDTKKNKVY